MHIRCIAHVINLVVQAFLYAIDEGDNPDVEDWYELNKDTPIHYDITKDQDQQALDSEGLDDDDNDNAAGDVSSENVNEMGSRVRVEPEEMLTVEEVGKGGPITCVCFLFS